MIMFCAKNRKIYIYTLIFSQGNTRKVPKKFIKFIEEEMEWVKQGGTETCFLFQIVLIFETSECIDNFWKK